MKLLFLVFALVGVSYAADMQPTPAIAVIERGLRGLIARDKGLDAFTIFTDEKSSAFIQFIYEEKSLWIDILLQEISDPERRRLEKVFASIGVLQPQVTTARDPGTMKTFTIRTYQASFGSDVERAAAFGMRIFREVFKIQLPNLSVQTE